MPVLVVVFYEVRVFRQLNSTTGAMPRSNLTVQLDTAHAEPSIAFAAELKIALACVTSR